MTTIRFAFTCQYYACKHFWTDEFPEEQTFKYGRGTRVRGIFNCPACGLRATEYKRIKGKKTDAECRGDCWTAKGTVCHCACGGDNHGRAFARVALGAPVSTHLTALQD